MANLSTNPTPPTNPDPSSANWQQKHVYILAAVCLLMGALLGYLFRGSASPLKTSNAIPTASESPTSTTTEPSARQMPTLDQMKHMADKQAEPLLVKLKTDPRNPGLLTQVAAIYKATHQFQEAAKYYDQAVQADPRNVATRTELAACLYYTGDVDGAINQLQQSLKDKPNDQNSLFNLGMIRWQGKKDSKGAIAAWQQLLKSNPQLESNKKAQVEKLIADAQLSQPN